MSSIEEKPETIGITSKGTVYNNESEKNKIVGELTEAEENVTYYYLFYYYTKINRLYIVDLTDLDFVASLKLNETKDYYFFA